LTPQERELLQSLEASVGQYKKVVSRNTFISWLWTQSKILKIVKVLLIFFHRVEIIEHHGQYYRLRVPRKEGKTIGYLLGMLQSIKEKVFIADF